MDKSLNIILADHHPSMIKGIMTELENDQTFKVVATTQHIEDVENHITRSTPNILVTDYWFRDVNIRNTIKKIRTRYPSLKIIIYTQEERVSYIKDILSNVNGYILKTEPEGTLTNAIKRVIQDKKAISEDVREYLEAERGMSSVLSPQEYKILNFRIEGINPLAISNQLSISEKTVRKHIDNARKKLGFKSTEDMIRTYLKQK